MLRCVSFYVWLWFDLWDSLWKLFNFFAVLFLWLWPSSASSLTPYLLLSSACNCDELLHWRCFLQNFSSQKLTYAAHHCSCIWTKRTSKLKKKQKRAYELKIWSIKNDLSWNIKSTFSLLLSLHHCCYRLCVHALLAVLSCQMAQVSFKGNNRNYRDPGKL